MRALVIAVSRRRATASRSPHARSATTAPATPSCGPGSSTTPPAGVVASIEGSRSYGVGLSRALSAAGLPVLEAGQPKRSSRRGKEGTVRRRPGGPAAGRRDPTPLRADILCSCVSRPDGAANAEMRTGGPSLHSGRPRSGTVLEIRKPAAPAPSAPPRDTRTGPGHRDLQLRTRLHGQATDTSSLHHHYIITTSSPPRLAATGSTDVERAVTVPSPAR
jgi:hypothetical protein